jgi:hypothetical protein
LSPFRRHFEIDCSVFDALLSEVRKQQHYKEALYLLQWETCDETVNNVIYNLAQGVKLRNDVTY